MPHPMEPERPEVDSDPGSESGEAPLDDPIFDYELILSAVDGDQQVLRQVVRLCLADLPRMSEELGLALEARDIAKLERLAHRAKGGLGMIGATASSRAAGLLESATEVGDLPAARIAVSQLLRELARLMPVLATLSEAA